VHEVGERVRGGARISAKRGEALHKAQGRGELMTQVELKGAHRGRGGGGRGAEGADQLNEAHGADRQVERGGEGRREGNSEAVALKIHIKGEREIDAGAALKGGEGVEDHSGARVHD
jgi:hypothetical protein